MKTRAVTFWIIALAACVCSLQVRAQETAQQDKAAQAAKGNAPTPSARPNPPVKTSSTEATVNLQTTVTGNQEQPRVLYILPWQSPVSGDIEFQTLSSQQEEVFGHLEREELRRSLEAEEVLNKNNP